MSTWIYIAAAIIGFVLLLGWLRRLSIRQSIDKGRHEAAQVQLDQIPQLAEECFTELRGKFGATLDLDHLDSVAREFDQLLTREKHEIKFTFSRPGQLGRFVLPLGAAFGEIIRKHSGAEWAVESGGAVLRIPIAGSTLTIRPFEEILEHFSKIQPPHQLEGKIQVACRKLFVFEDEAKGETAV
jgi:hypothetical protein